jgi:hypothetical protein
MVCLVVESSGSRRVSADAAELPREEDDPDLWLPGTAGADWADGVDCGEADFWLDNVDKGMDPESASDEGFTSCPSVAPTSANMERATRPTVAGRIVINLVKFFSCLPQPMR